MLTAYSGADWFFIYFFHTDIGSVALYSTQDDEPLTMNCDIDGTSGRTQLCLHGRGLHAASCDHEITLLNTYVSNACVGYFRREPGGSGREDEANKPGFGTAAHA